MTQRKTKVALLFGGRSAEHEVSILSARSVWEAAPADLFEIVPVCVARDGTFLKPSASRAVLRSKGVETATGDGEFDFPRWFRKEAIDIAFPLIHGTNGEDGRLQGYLEILGIPYVGSGVTPSAVGMDKALMKQAFVAAKLPIVEFVAVSEVEWREEQRKVMQAIGNSLRLPYFVKPANAGSSVGVTKVRKPDALAAAIEHAFRFDEKVLVERGIEARELEVAVLGNEHPKASVVGEITPGAEFYDYSDKYIDDKSRLTIPASISQKQSAEIRALALAAFRAVNASGYARVDFFLDKGTKKILVNEINTIPGFTSISMYPKLWGATELKYPALITEIIHLGIVRSRERAARFQSMMSWFDEVEHLG
ncbi:MAG: D-alanine--D-alanine ligase [Thermoanaerobaculia bacterium]|nr:D-alanine--D-alanine ligase [Thermoanaerobaculia bacterium]